jgi:hypothetical protein
VQENTPRHAHRGVTDERAGQHQARDELGSLGRGDHRGPGGHGVADDDRGTAEFADQRDDVGGGFLVAVGRERGVAVAVAAKIGAGHVVADAAFGSGEVAGVRRSS